ncbi:MAG: type II toxin-antitoxin system prevent-host-death family antitoxin [Bifidobacteriaceae bacterium]|nr:type II toxin-antitoxin system prevent-host-death family antitoxin [Bifidobacteriaceae bacterium]
MNPALALSTIYDAKTHLSRLVAGAEEGRETVLTRHGRPVARIAPLKSAVYPAASPHASLRDWYERGPRAAADFGEHREQLPAEERPWW